MSCELFDIAVKLAAQRPLVRCVVDGEDGVLLLRQRVSAPETGGY